MSKIEIKNVSMDYVEKNNHFTALEDVSLNIEQGEFVSILGASGCGKSTLLSILEGLRKPTKGEVYIDGKKMSGPGKDRGVVFQNYSLFPWMTARNNVIYGIEQVTKGIAKKSERIQRADEFLEKVNLGQYKNKFPLQLSGGQQQRVAIARALAMDTEILLMDEPFGAIDPKTRVVLQELLLSLWEGEGLKKKTVVFVTHDIDEAIFLSDKIVMMAPNPGRVYREVEVPFKRPRNRYEMIKTPEYQMFRNQLVSMFYGEETLLEREVI